MRPIRTLLAAAVLAATLLPTSARAAGYAIYEQGASVLGMAGAAVASVHDASAVFYNPAAMTRLEGTTQVYVGGAALQPIMSFAGMGPYPGYGVADDAVRQTFYPPSVYATRKLPRGMAVGVGVNAPFGLGVEWNPVTFSGRYIVTKVDLQTLNAMANLAWAPNDMLSIAAGPDIMWAKVKLANRSLISDPYGGGGTLDVAQAQLTSGFTPGPGWNAGVLFTPDPKWLVGAYYRSKIVVHVDDADADFTQIPTGDAALDASVAANLPPDQKVHTVLHFPAMWSVAAAFKPTPAWTVEADFDLHEWHVFQDLPIRFVTTPSRDQVRLENYRTGWQIRTGAEHRLKAFTYRFGYYFDKAPAPTEAVSPLLPDADRHGVALGLGLNLGADKRWTVDAYEVGLFVKDRYGVTASGETDPADSFHGKYRSYVNLAGVSVGYRW